MGEFDSSPPGQTNAAGSNDMIEASPIDLDKSEMQAVEISVISPVFNEEGNLFPLYASLLRALEPLNRSFELIFIDDCSLDGSFAELSTLAAADRRVTVIQFRRNFGQTAAFAAGVDYASGHVVVFIDSDLQNDPADIPRLLNLIDHGYDAVSGWRKDRHDSALTRKLPSQVANALISMVTGVRLHDYGCSLKAYRADLLKQVQLYGEMHRFIPAYLALIGARITEIPVNHSPRIRGTSKYGLARTLKVILDLLTVKFLGTFATKPIYAFGGIGLVLVATSVLVGIAMVWQKLELGVSMIQTPLLLLAVLLFLMGFQCLLMGLLSEITMRTYHESQGKRTYVVRHVLRS
jgi:glycosyltransferase involved in cell wall biosynthesis